LSVNKLDPQSVPLIPSVSVSDGLTSVGETPELVADNSVHAEVISPQAGGRNLYNTAPGALGDWLEGYPALISSVRLSEFQLDGFRELLTARLTEQWIDDATTSNLYATAESDVGDPELLASINQRVDEEIELADTRIQAFDEILRMRKIAYAGYGPVCIPASSEFMDAIIKTGLSPEQIDPLISAEMISANWRTTLSRIAGLGNPDAHAGLQVLPNTMAYIFILDQLEFMMLYGVSSGLMMARANQQSLMNTIGGKLNHAVNYLGAPPPGASNTHRYLRKATSRADAQHDHPPRSLPTIGDHTGNQARLTITGNARDNFDKILQRKINRPGLNAVDRLVYYSCALSREFAMSVGKGLLQGVPLGQKYGVGEGASLGSSGWEGILRNLLGTQHLSTNLDPWDLANRDLFIPGSLSELAVYPGRDPQGSDPRQVILALEGHNGINPDEPRLPIGDRSNTTGRAAWIDSLASGGNMSQNRLGELNAWLNEAETRFSDAGDIISSLLCRGMDADLLTPRGLFTRIISDFSTYLEGVGETSANGSVTDDAVNKACEISIFSAMVGTPTDTTRCYYWALLKAAMQEKMAGSRETEEGGIETDAMWEDFNRDNMRVRLVPNENDAYEKDVEDDGNKDSRWRLFSDALVETMQTPGVYGRTIGEVNALYRPSNGYSSCRVTGLRYSEVFSSWSGADLNGRSASERQPLLRDIIIKIFNDMQDEAKRLVASENDQASYLDASNQTLNGAFDGQRAMFFLLQSFITLVDTYVPTFTIADVGLKIDEASQGHVRHLKDAPQNFVVLNTGHTAPGASPIQQGTTVTVKNFLRELAAASRADDLSGIVTAGADGTQEFTPGIRELLGGGQAAEFTGLGTSLPPGPAALVDGLISTAREEEMPYFLLSTAHSFIKNIKNRTSEWKALGMTLAGTIVPDDPPPATKTLLQLQGEPESDYARRFIAEVSAFSISQARKRLSDIRDATAPDYLLEKTEPSILKAYNYLIDEMAASENSPHAVVFVGTTPGQLQALSPAGLDQDSIVRVQIQKADVAYRGLKFNNLDFKFCPQLKTRMGYVLEVLTSSAPLPINIEALALAVKWDVAGLDYPIAGGDLAGPSHERGDQRIARNNYRDSFTKILGNHMRSFLLKNMFEDVYGMAFSSEKIVRRLHLDRSDEVRPLMQLLSRPMGIDQDAVDKIFANPTSAQTSSGFVDAADPSAKVLKGYSQLDLELQPSRTEIGGEPAWNVPRMTQTQVEAIQNFFATKPFFLNRVATHVFSPSMFESVFALLVPLGVLDPGQGSCWRAMSPIRQLGRYEIVTQRQYTTLYDRYIHDAELERADFFSMTVVNANITVADR